MDTIKPTILLVEDQKQFMQMNKILCTFPGCEPKFLEAQNGVEARQVLKKHRDEITLMITDIDMPELNGIQLLRLEEVQRFIPVVVLTAHPHYERTAYDLRVVLFLDKSDDPDRNTALLEPAIRFAYTLHTAKMVRDKTVSLANRKLEGLEVLERFAHACEAIVHAKGLGDVFSALTKAFSRLYDCHFRMAIRFGSGKAKTILLGDEREPDRDAEFVERMILQKALLTQEEQVYQRRWAKPDSSSRSWIAILVREPHKFDKKDRNAVHKLVELLVNQASRQVELLNYRGTLEENR